MLWTLGIETSTRLGNIAVSADGEIRAYRSLGAVSQQHAQGLFVEIDAAFQELGLVPTDLKRIAVSQGPGSFTGLRIGIVAAKTLGWSLGVEIKAIDTFLAIAANLSEPDRETFVVGDAQRGDLFVGRYELGGDGHWHNVEPIRVVNATEFVSGLTPGDLVTGPGLSRYEAQISKKCRVSSRDLWQPRADRLCLLAQRDDLGPADFWALEPFYLRKSAAEEKWDASQNMP